MSKPKWNIFHVIIRPKNELYREIDYDKLIVGLDELGPIYCITEENNNHLHIALKFDYELRQDDVRKRLKRCLNLDRDSNQYVALKVKFHGDWEYLLGYIHKDGKIKDFSYELNWEEVNRGIDRYRRGDKAEYKESMPEYKKHYWTCDEIVENFIEFSLKIKIDTYHEWAWTDFLSRSFDKFKFSTFARIRKDPLIEHVNAGLKYYKLYKNKKSGENGMDITKELSIPLENKNDTAYIDDMFNDLT